MVGNACVGHEVQWANLHRLMLDARVVVRVSVRRIVVFELEPVEAFDGPIRPGFDEKVLLGRRDVKDVEGLPAGVLERGRNFEGDGGIGGGLQGVSSDSALELQGILSEGEGREHEKSEEAYEHD